MARVLNDLPRWITVSVWIIANIIYFTVTYFRFDKSDEYYYTRKILGPALAWARASAAALNLNCMLILLPVCRNLVSFLRGSFQKCCNRNIRRQLDKHITFHRYIAYMICLMTVIHVGAHVFNVERYAEAYDSPTPDRELLRVLSGLGSGNSSIFLNPIREPTDPILATLRFLAGVSGIVITLSLIIMVSAATELIRRSYFEVFWFTHHLFVLFFIGLVVHGFEGIVRRQTPASVSQHNPLNCSANPSNWGKRDSSGQMRCPIPEFEGISAKAWMWTIGPMVIYIIERIVRFVRSQQRVVITKVVKHPSRVYQLRMQKKGFKMLPGQYIFVHCPSISKLEWHPFTLTSAPEDDYFSIHVRRAGDWTDALAKACHIDDDDYTSTSKLPMVAVDGPFGTATEDIFWYEVDVFVAAGIGVTPFASILKHIRYQCMNPDGDMKLRKVYFYWVCPDTNSFEWMQELLQEFDTQMAEQGNTNFLTYNIYLTRGWDKDQAQNIILHEGDEADPVTGLQQKTHYGRPNWDKIFENISKDHAGISVGVFFCGPSGLSNTLHQMSNKHSAVDKTGAKFFYNKENF